MKWPSRVQEIVSEIARRNSSLLIPDEESRRKLTLMFAQQCRFELGSNWGTKRADSGRPLSKDTICTRNPFIGWDTQIGGSVITVAEFPDSVDLTGQVFVEVEPINHLEFEEEKPKEEKPDIPDKLDWIEVLLRKIVELEKFQIDLMEEIKDRQDRVVSGSGPFGVKIVLRPENRK